MSTVITVRICSVSLFYHLQTPHKLHTSSNQHNPGIVISWMVYFGGHWLEFNKMFYLRRWLSDLCQAKAYNLDELTVHPMYMIWQLLSVLRNVSCVFIYLHGLCVVHMLDCVECALSYRICYKRTTWKETRKLIIKKFYNKQKDSRKVYVTNNIGNNFKYKPGEIAIGFSGI